MCIEGCWDFLQNIYISIDMLGPRRDTTTAGQNWMEEYKTYISFWYTLYIYLYIVTKIYIIINTAKRQQYIVCYNTEKQDGVQHTFYIGLLAYINIYNTECLLCYVMYIYLYNIKYT